MNSIVFFDSKDSRFAEVRRIRSQVFTAEQGADSKSEFDSYDVTADFALLYNENKPVATARIAYTPSGVKIGRIAVIRQCRGRGFGRDIVNAVTKKAFSDGADKVFVDAQLHAVPFYEKLGFCVIGSEIIDRGLAHLPMMIEKENYHG